MDQLDNLHYNNGLRIHMVIRPLMESGGLHIGFCKLARARATAGVGGREEGREEKRRRKDGRLTHSLDPYMLPHNSDHSSAHMPP